MFQKHKKPIQLQISGGVEAISSFSIDDVKKQKGLAGGGS